MGWQGGERGVPVLGSEAKGRKSGIRARKRGGSVFRPEYTLDHAGRERLEGPVLASLGTCVRIGI